MEKDLRRITNILILKQNFYYLTIKVPYGNEEEGSQGYRIIPDEWNLYNGFEYPQDALAYLHKIQTEINPQ